jgi:hypothetical protein
VPRHGKRDAPKEPATQPNLHENNARRGGRFTGNEAGMCYLLLCHKEFQWTESF